jgi:hypothetical protein
VCKIGNEGCNYPQQSCFCQCETLGASCQHWIYFQRIEDNWRYSALGANQRKVKNGDVDGWIWAKGRVDGAEAAPPLLTFDQLCSATNVIAQQPQPAATRALPAQASSPQPEAIEPSPTTLTTDEPALPATATIASPPTPTPRPSVTRAIMVPQMTTASSPSPSPTAQATQAITQDANTTWTEALSYVAFATIVLCLVGGWLLARRRGST